MAKSTVGWFGVREKYYSLADKPWLISQIRPNEQADCFGVSLMVLASVLESLTLRIFAWYWIMAWMRAS